VFNVLPLPRTLEAAERDLNDPKPDVRVSAARDLGRADPGDERERRVAALVRALGDQVPAVRKQALLSLADHAAEEATPRVLSLLGDADSAVRQMAVLALGEVASVGHAESVGRLTGLLSAGDSALRYQALSALVRLSPAEARKNVVAALGDSDAEVRALALRLLEESLLADAQALDAELESKIRAAASDSDARVALLAQLMGGELGLDVPVDAVVALVNGAERAGEPRDEQVAIELCGRLRIAAATAGLRRRAFGPWGVSFDPFRWQARAGLAGLGDARARAKMEKCLARGGFHDRTLAVFAVGQVGLERFRPDLERLLGQAERVDQEVLGEALARLGSPT